MNSKSWALLSLFVSIISLMVSVTILVNYHPRENLSFDYIGMIVGILALLVTALIGAQVSQYVFVDKKVEKIADKITRIIAHKSANDVARKTAAESVKKMQENLWHIATASNRIVESTIAYTLCIDTKYIFKVLATVEEYLQIDDKKLSNKLVDEFLTEQLPKIQKMKADGELKVREEHQPVIKEFLDECEFPHNEELQELLRDVRTITEQEETHTISHFRS